MEYGIALTPVTPMRADVSECAEMVSQLLFGEHFRILDKQPRWLFVENSFDHYRGWIDAKMATIIDEEEFIRIESASRYVIRMPISDLKCDHQKAPIRVSMGSLLPGYDVSRRLCVLAGRAFRISPNAMVEVKINNIKSLLRTAELFLNTPYLWGGRHILGIDCSGFVQTVFRINGVHLPRDASQQIEEGLFIADFTEAISGDLAFFANESGRIIHVGIMHTPNTIIHASGTLHIDRLTAEGIWSDSMNKYTHSKPIIKRILQINRR